MAVKKKTMPQPNTDKSNNDKYCVCCGNRKDVSKFYKNANRYINEDAGICKTCIETVGATNDMKEIHRMLRLMDIVFLPDRWEACTSSENTLVTYVSNGKGINNPKATVEGIKIVDMRYEDSPTYNAVEDVDKFLISSDADKLENIARWGEHYSQAEYMKMNMSVENNIKVTGRDDYHSMKNFERVARAEVERDRAYSNTGLKPQDKKSAEDNVTNMMKQAGLTFEQTSRSVDSTLGMDIRDVIENYEPVPEPMEEFKDVDGMGTYFYKFVLVPLMRCLGKDASKTIDDYHDIREDILRRKSKFSGGDSE